MQAPHFRIPPSRPAENAATTFYIPPPPTDEYLPSPVAQDQPATNYEEMYAYEPDLSKRPVRSALKGGKNKELFQRQLEERLSLKPGVGFGGDSGALPTVQFGSLKKQPPKVAPKPGHMALVGVYFHWLLPSVCVLFWWFSSCSTFWEVFKRCYVVALVITIFIIIRRFM